MRLGQRAVALLSADLSAEALVRRRKCLDEGWMREGVRNQWNLADWLGAPNKVDEIRD